MCRNDDVGGHIVAATHIGSSHNRRAKARRRGGGLPQAFRVPIPQGGIGSYKAAASRRTQVPLRRIFWASRNVRLREDNQVGALYFPLPLLHFFSTVWCHGFLPESSPPAVSIFLTRTTRRRRKISAWIFMPRNLSFDRRHPLEGLVHSGDRDERRRSGTIIYTHGHNRTRVEMPP